MVEKKEMGKEVSGKYPPKQDERIWQYSYQGWQNSPLKTLTKIKGASEETIKDRRTNTLELHALNKQQLSFKAKTIREKWLLKYIYSGIFLVYLFRMKSKRQKRKQLCNTNISFQLKNICTAIYNHQIEEIRFFTILQKSYRNVWLCVQPQKSGKQRLYRSKHLIV